MTRSGSCSDARASAQRSVPLRHPGEVMITPTPTALQASAMRSSSVVSNTLDVATKVAVGNDANKITILICHADHTKALGGHLDHRIVHRTSHARQRQSLAVVHQPPNRAQPRPERAARVEPAEIGASEATLT